MEQRAACIVQSFFPNRSSSTKNNTTNTTNSSTSVTAITNTNYTNTTSSSSSFNSPSSFSSNNNSYHTHNNNMIILGMHIRHGDKYPSRNIIPTKTFLPYCEAFLQEYNNT